MRLKKRITTGNNNNNTHHHGVVRTLQSLVVLGIVMVGANFGFQEVHRYHVAPTVISRSSLSSRGGEVMKNMTEASTTTSDTTTTTINNSSIALMIRTYAGDRFRASTIALPTISMFVNPLQFDFYLILDAESQLDQQWGKCLQDDSGDTGLLSLPTNMKILYESQPPNHQELFHATAFAEIGNPQYNKPGYDRQQWSTFYMDQHVAQSNHEMIISIMDADGCFFSYWTRDNILSDDGRIMLRAGREESHYDMDREALKLPTPYEFMYINRMPVSFWKSTFVNLRKFVEDQWKVSHFNDAFKEFSKGRYSQFNILATYAITMEPDKYVLIPHDGDGGEAATVSVASNRCRPNDSVPYGPLLSFSVDVGPNGKDGAHSEIITAIHLEDYL